MECLPVDHLPDAPGWVYELKLDGYRGQAIHDSRGLHLLSRKGKHFANKIPAVFGALKHALPIGTALDGELVAFDENGQPSFNAIQNSSAETNVVFFVFDVLFHGGQDVQRLPLSDRLDLLESAFAHSARVQLSAHFPGPADQFITAIRKMGGEGVVAKRLGSRYESEKGHGPSCDSTLDKNL